MISIMDGTSKYCFYWRHEEPPSPDRHGDGQPRSLVLGFSSDGHARFLLQQLQQSWGFRRLSASDKFIDSVGWSSDQVLAHLARQLTTGRLLVERRWRQMPAQPTAKVEGKVVVPRKAASSDSPAPAVAPMFSAQNDPASQAETLAEAAANGTPFCEECERARQQAAA
jgi:hypothetical protein